MSNFRKEVVMNDMYRFAEGIEESYSVQSAWVLEENQPDNVIHLGYKVKKNTRTFKAFMPYTKRPDGTYQLPHPTEWTLVEVNEEGQTVKEFSEKYRTLGRFMDAIYEAVE